MYEPRTVYFATIYQALEPHERDDDKLRGLYHLNEVQSRSEAIERLGRSVLKADEIATLYEIVFHREPMLSILARFSRVATSTGWTYVMEVFE